MSWIADYLRNLGRGEMSPARRLQLIARNYGRRVARRQSCCGHPGEPGC